MSYAHADTHKTGIPNLIHASGDADEAKLEIAHWFSEAELYEYETAHERFTQTKQK
jgi:nucleoside-diphosphate kinase